MHLGGRPPWIVNADLTVGLGEGEHKLLLLCRSVLPESVATMIVLYLIYVRFRLPSCYSTTFHSSERRKAAEDDSKSDPPDV